ncbi:type IV secretion system DNA-binding domain-containing protein [Conexibacter sp. W3-3-2]|uniref:type IV secretory system conjugative DNA transfer family protein n=1 Tax=Conexibacter sp. W3-3-2 TaxID=2675227 RepID=UPI0012B96BB7|nr:type IV secretion system DNA-binding domain-containing protein [Conexibacter sp. W3-3-2]MTD44876.1 type IV secretion system DNA-binding domain-containing protein [Conexibacter sp. W3-3-2]
MATHHTASPNPEQTRRDALLVATVLAALALFIGATQLARHPITALVAAALGTTLATTVLAVRARVRDRLATHSDPPRKGIVIGTVRGAWRLARPRPYVLGWDSFRQHVLITGPTGRGKSYGFIAPILRGHMHRRDTGVLYMDGKGDPIHHGSDAVTFDHVFYPEDPASSAHWNPLAGPDPFTAARSFADAIFPTAGLPGAVYYEVRGAFAIRTVAPAIAYTGLGLEHPPTTSEDDVRTALLVAGLSESEATHALTYGVGACEDQLRWLPTRKRQTPEALLDFITNNNRPSPAIDETLLMPRAATPTIAALHHVLFTDGQLDELAKRLDGLLDEHATDLARERFKLLAAQVRTLATLPAKERAAVLSNLENRIAVFLTPPFDRLCSRSDFTLADICAGRSIAMLLPAGTFPGIAEPLGRVALAQFQQAVLSSTPEVTKVAVLDEFHNFVSPAFTKFLAQARSRGGAAVMSTQTIADFHIDYRDQLLANASTQIVTPGALPFDAEHWSRAFGEHETEQRSTTTAPRSILDPAPLPSVRSELRDTPRFTPTHVTELATGEALIRQVNGRTAYPATVVNVERRHA